MPFLYYVTAGAFAVLTFLVLYTYVGYGLVAWLLVRIRRGPAARPARRPPAVPVLTWPGLVRPSVTIVVPAYNERAYLPEKLANCRQQNYDADRVRLLFVVDGSTDGSVEYLREQQALMPNLDVLTGTERLGKVAAMNRAMRAVETPVTIFTDANALLNPEAVSQLVRRFEQPGVGAVTGEKRIHVHGREAAAGSGEGLYWRYESFLKRLDAQLHTIVGAAGELFAIRTDLYEPVEPDTLLDDFMISLRIAGRGYRVDYAPDAYALERPSHSVGEEMKRKVRIATGGFQAISRLPYLLNVFRYGWLSFQYVSHRVLRWAVTPFCLPLLVLLNGSLLSQSVPGSPAWGFWAAGLAAQTAFYGAAAVGYVLEHRHTRWKLTFVPFYFVFMNWCVLVGFARFCSGGLSGVWEKAERAV